MYTTLNMLKTAQACKPGYSRMLAFFGLDKTIRDQRIPLHVVALVGEYGDATWAISNEIVIDLEDFAIFRKRHLVAVWKRLLSAHVTDSRTRQNRNEYKLEKRDPAVKALVTRAYSAHTYEAVTEIINTVHIRYENHRFFTHVLYGDELNNPYLFVKQVLEMLTQTYSKNSAIADPSRFPAVTPPAPTPSNNRLGPDDEDDFEDDESDDEDDEDVEEDTLSANQVYYLTTSKAEYTKAQNLAYAFSDTPYAFMQTMKYRMPKGISINTGADGKTTFSVTSDGEEEMFAIVQAINAMPKSKISMAETTAVLNEPVAPPRPPTRIRAGVARGVRVVRNGQATTDSENWDAA